MPLVSILYTISIAIVYSTLSSRNRPITCDMRETHGEDETAWPPFAVVDDKEVVSAEHRWRGRFVRTKHDVGLTKAQADALIDILSR